MANPAKNDDLLAGEGGSTGEQRLAFLSTFDGCAHAAQDCSAVDPDIGL